MTQVRLTELSHGAGCACKLDPGALHPLLADLHRPADADLLVGFDTADDAAAYRVSDELAVVTTADFFTPVVDDAYDFGRIAAANALSDVYAMGARPIMALNLVAWSIDELGGGLLRDILRGGSDVAREAGVALAGGHSIDDSEPKYGMAVTGVCHPDDLVRNSTAAAGHELWLTKPLGGGVVSTAAKRGSAPAGLVERSVEVMVALNADASAAARAAGVSAMTDVTGFGLAGHLHEMAKSSGVSAELDAAAIPSIEGVLDLLRAPDPPIAGGTRRNRAWLGDALDFDASVPDERRWLVCDAMTSGGLLVAAPPGADLPGALIGHLGGGRPGAIRVSA